jgi:hypothetical protein
MQISESSGPIILSAIRAGNLISGGNSLSVASSRQSVEYRRASALICGQRAVVGSQWSVIGSSGLAAGDCPPSSAFCPPASLGKFSQANSLKSSTAFLSRAPELIIDDCRAVLAMTCLRLMIVAVIREEWPLREAEVMAPGAMIGGWACAGNACDAGRPGRIRRCDGRSPPAGCRPGPRRGAAVP